MSLSPVRGYETFKKGAEGVRFEQNIFDNGIFNNSLSLRSVKLIYLNHGMVKLWISN